jgi:hypothetical protein
MIKRPEHDANRWLTFSAEVKKQWIIFSIPHMPSRKIYLILLYTQEYAIDLFPIKKTGWTVASGNL